MLPPPSSPPPFLQLCKALLDIGANMNLYNKVGITSFSSACLHGQVAIASYMLQVGLGFMTGAGFSSWVSRSGCRDPSRASTARWPSRHTCCR